MIEMVAGFRFDYALQNVVLIQKSKPAWQAGRLNGVGGKIEGDETGLDAMVREFEEETGLLTERFEWKSYATIQGEDFRVFFYYSVGDISNVKTNETEPVVIVKIDDISIRDARTIENLPWLISMALDHEADNRPHYAHVRY